MPKTWMVIVIVLGLLASMLMVPAHNSMERSHAAHKHAVIKVYNLLQTRRRGVA